MSWSVHHCLTSAVTESLSEKRASMAVSPCDGDAPRGAPGLMMKRDVVFPDLTTSY